MLEADFVGSIEGNVLGVLDEKMSGQLLEDLLDKRMAM